MIQSDLHKILDDKNRELSITELKQIIFELKQESFVLSEEAIAEYRKIRKETEKNEQMAFMARYKFHDGEKNAFKICLDLIDHWDECIIGEENYATRILNAITILRSVEHCPKPLDSVINNALKALLGDNKKYNKEG